MYVYVRVYIVPISERALANRESVSGLRVQSYDYHFMFETKITYKIPSPPSDNEGSEEE